MSEMIERAIMTKAVSSKPIGIGKGMIEATYRDTSLTLSAVVGHEGVAARLAIALGWFRDEDAIDFIVAKLPSYDDDSARVFIVKDDQID